MAPTKPKVARSNTSRSQSSSFKKKSNKSTAPPPKQQKTKRPTSSSKPSEVKKRKKKHAYTAEQLGVPALNGIIPAGVSKPKGKKKGKVFVDDPERMVMILSIVNSEAEGKVESKMMRQRQLEEVREARRLEAEKREMEKKGALVCASDSLAVEYAIDQALSDGHLGRREGRNSTEKETQTQKG